MKPTLRDYWREALTLGRFCGGHYMGHEAHLELRLFGFNQIFDDLLSIRCF